MAIPFLNNIDLSDNQLLNAKLQITGTAPAAEQGQIYFNSAAGFLKPRVYDGAAWLNILDTTSVISGTYVSSTVTSNVDITLDLSAVDGTSTAASMFLTKDNEWATIPFGDITAVLAGTYINIDNSTGPEPTVNHDLTTRTDTASAASPGSAGTFTTIDSVTTNTTGHITALNLKTITLPLSDAYTSWNLSGDSGTLQTILSGNTALFTGGTKITTAVAATDVLTITHDAQAQTDTTSTAAPGYLGTFTAIDTVSRDSTGHVTGVNVKTITIPASDDTTYDLTTAPTGTAVRLTGSDSTNDDVTISGTAGRTAMSRISASELRVDLTDDVTIVNDLTVGNNVTLTGGNLDVTGTGSFTGQVTIPQVPTADTDAASKHYVDQAVTGALSYQGAYDAATNTPDLDSSPSSDIKTGWTYTVTVEGLFFTEQVRVGDVLIANNNAPTTLAEWTTVQNNIDLASLTTVGIGNVAPGEAMNVAYSNGTATVSVEKSSATNMGAVIVKGTDPINVSYDTSGNATVGIEDSAAAQKGAVIVSAGTGISVAYVAGEATVTNTETNSSNTYAVTITDTATITHSLGTKDVIIQLYDVTTNETVYADVERGSTSEATITFAATPTNSVRVLVQKIG